MGIVELAGRLGAFGLLIIVVALLGLLLYRVPIPLWVAAWASGACTGLLTLIAMRLRRVPPGTVLTARISAVKAGLDLSINDPGAHFLAGGKVVNAVNAPIFAESATIPLSFRRASAKAWTACIGASVSHKDVLENPDHISKHVLGKGLDAGTAQEILSIDTAIRDAIAAADEPASENDRPGPRTGG
ncbi:MAG: hypothetical protein RIS35_3362 [Pseudomonadota bacterium]|jgi:uncharacterized protein YqfA (UPF0365 family)